MNVKLDVQPDHLEDVAKTRPILGLAELIWNAVDADANTVSVTYKKNALGGIESVRVADDGHGIEHTDAITSFGRLGGSWKKTQRVSQKQKRALHGQEGKGRFKAFCLGNAIIWTSTYKENGSVKSFRIVGKRPALNQFDVTDASAAKTDQLGTIVEISDVRDGVDSLNDAQRVADELARRLAIYLRKYPSVKIDIEGVPVDPRRVESHTADYQLPTLTLDDGQTFKVKLNVIEWAVPTDRALYLCDSSGFAKEEVSPGIRAKGWNFTAYLSSDAVPVLEERGALALKELHPDYVKLLELAKRQMKVHFTQRDAETAASIVEGWKKDGIYPYGGNPKDLIEQTERQVFDVVAMQLAEALPDFDESDPKSKKLSMRLLKQAIEKSPEEVQSIFAEVLGLPQDKQADLAELLKRTSLASIISAAKLVSGRLDFLRGLELLLFHPVSKEQLLERTQLHKIVEEHTWLWGEEFALSASDQNLNDVLVAHLGKLRKASDEDPDVVREDGSAGIVDLMLSRVIPQPRAEEREHLIVELKRPNVSINRDIISQAQSYADAVADDPRFKDTSTRWVFWVVSNKMTDSGRKQATQANRARGLCYESETGHIKVWAKTWGEIIQANKARMEFFQQRLQYKVDDQSALDALRKMHSKYLPPVFVEVKADAPAVDGTPLAPNAPQSPTP
ncbi:MAG TPA: ATP-binding protein [Phycisphaerales bacterium]|nr:ATP-binding protein [Phycisphaerales bacterium]